MVASGKVLLLAMCLVLSILTSVTAQFNIYKNYNGVPAGQRPGTYAVKNTKHSIDEYMTDQQKMMRAQRNGPITSDNSMGNNWSGFDEFRKINTASKAAAARTAVSATKAGNLRGSKSSATLSTSPQGVSS